MYPDKCGSQPRLWTCKGEEYQMKVLAWDAKETKKSKPQGKTMGTTMGRKEEVIPRCKAAAASSLQIL